MSNLLETVGGTGHHPQKGLDGEAYVAIKSDTSIQAILQRYEAEIYPAATSGSGALIDNLQDYLVWSFHVVGADATNVFVINVGNEGTVTNQDTAQVKSVSGDAAVTSIVAAGLYTLAVPMPFRDLQVVRSGVGTTSCKITAIGRVQS